MTRDEDPTSATDRRTAPPWQEPMPADRSVHFLEPRLAARRRAVLPGVTRLLRDRGRHVHDDLAEAGMATAEYAIATLAAVGFAGLLVVILRGDEVKGLLLALIRQALAQ
ncbi:DUF4244 domain-containing protein [Cellulomonas sp. URHD0024]|uniref:DUF4244 domain-containing protein n=1 Tax=Cellulomonas sp. URHD0024 TaxID=1302620 RepID=UPI00068569C0|nr:DUF4244 domain-containing protein [Cellulomonas sp. URHD0024]